MIELTATYAQKILNYNSTTGELFWAERRQGRRRDRSVGKMHGGGYLQVCVDGRLYKAHRLIFLLVFGRWPQDQIDHINGIRTDNRIENLREVNSKGNNRNQGLTPRNSSGFVGVSWCKKSQKWRAFIMLNNRFKHLGLFVHIQDAIQVREAANVKYGFHRNHGLIRDA